MQKLSKIGFYVTENLFSGHAKIFYGIQSNFCVPKSVFVIPEVTTFLPEVKIVKPEIRPKNVHKTFMYSNLFVST